MDERLARVAEEAPAAVLPITKAKGPDAVYEALKDLAGRGALHTGPPSRSVEIGGAPMKMTMPQYEQYLERSSAAARPRLLALVNSPAWPALNDERKAAAVAKIVAHARKAARQRVKAEIAREAAAQRRAKRAAGG
jgi:hypothetical protein